MASGCSSVELKEEVGVEIFVTLRIEMNMIIYSECGLRKTELSFGNWFQPRNFFVHGSH